MTGSCTYSSVLWTLFAFMPSYDAVLRLENYIRWETLQLLSVPDARDMSALRFATELCVLKTMDIEHQGYEAAVKNNCAMMHYMHELRRGAPVHQQCRRRLVDEMFRTTREDPMR
eukprot:343736-Pleurochrysis_carterae.AAC.1